MPDSAADQRTRRDRPYWSQVLRSLREACGASQDGWALRLGVGRATIQRWEAGELAPGAEAEGELLRLCTERGLYRYYNRGPLGARALTPELLRTLLAEARLDPHGERSLSLATVAAHGADRQTPHPPVPERSAGNLPVTSSSFVGRDHERGALLDLLAAERLLVLTGTGGVGKTRLALAVAASLETASVNVRFVDLAPLTQPALVPQAVAAALGVREPPTTALIDALVHRLQQQNTVLLLDNCEHLLDAAGTLAMTLLGACPELRILATSRQPLAVPGAAIRRIPPLRCPPAGERSLPALLTAAAVRLFIERAQTVEPAFSLSAADALVVSRICQRLDGIPLAIELAAARVKALTVDQIATRLDDRFHLLTRGARLGSERQQTLRATLDWSYDLLTTEESTLFRRLAVFAGDCGIEAVETVCSDASLPANCILDCVENLVDKSLLVVERTAAEARYRYLETVRQYATERLAAVGETARLRARQLAWADDLVEQALRHLQGFEQQAWFARLSREVDNVRAALAWSLDEGGDHAAGLRLAANLRSFWFTRGYASEGRRWLARVLMQSEAEAPLLRAHALDAAAALAHSQGDYAAVRQLLERSLMLWRAAGDNRGVAGALNLLALAEKDGGGRERAAGILEEALVLMRRSGDMPGTSMVLNNLAAVSIDLGDYARAASLNGESLAIKRTMGDHVGVVVALDNLAEAARLQHDFARAAAYAEEAVALARAQEVPLRIAQSLHILGVALIGLDRPDAALTALRESLSLFAAAETAWGIAVCGEGLALLAAHRGAWARATSLLGTTQLLREQLGAPLTSADQAETDRILSEARAALGDEHYHLALAIGRAVQRDDVVAHLLEAVSEPA